jgi:tetratricopeptide (TPR) repeat protein
MSEPSCPVCEGILPAAASACPTCGYPTALREEAVRAFLVPEPLRAAAPAPPVREEPAARPAPVARPGPSPVEPLAAELAKGIAALRRLGLPTESFLTDLQRAAAAEAAGRSDEAVSDLREALERLSAASRSIAETRLRELEERRRALASAGVLDGLDPDVDRVRKAISEGRHAQATELVGSADARARQIEADLGELTSSLATTEELWAVAGSAGLPPSGLKERVAHLRRYLAGPRHSADEVGAANRSARELLGLLRSELTSGFTAELARNSDLLGRYPVDDPGALVARRQITEAAGRTREGRLVEAAESIAQLRRTIESLPPPAEARETARRTAPTSKPAGPKAEVTRASLIETTRGLAARVRSLPPGSALAAQAAKDIRHATALLAQHKNLEEAHEVLVRLIERLDAADESAAREPGG